ncbi:hypothetical protein O1L60_21305 [Streptomyces diastatochromogenes]|nr:hypothetical protein [Streptomyces diastatochromogenes]
MTMTTPEQNVGATTGLPALGPEGTRLLRLLDDTFEGWGVAAGARPLTMPPLLPAADLAKLDYYDNFPHQAVVAAPLDLERRATTPFDPRAGRFPSEALEPAALGLPSASCYAVYLTHQGTRVADDTLVTICSWCFRKETHYEGMRRQLGFRMREIVALGSREHAENHLAEFTTRVQSFAAALDLPLRRRPPATLLRQGRLQGGPPAAHPGEVRVPVRGPGDRLGQHAPELLRRPLRHHPGVHRRTGLHQLRRLRPGAVAVGADPPPRRLGGGDPGGPGRGRAGDLTCRPVPPPRRRAAWGGRTSAWTSCPSTVSAGSSPSTGSASSSGCSLPASSPTAAPPRGSTS